MVNAELRAAVEHLCQLTSMRPKACTAEELLEVERQLGVPLPAAYRWVMECDGHNGLEAMVGTSWNLASVVRNQAIASDLLAEDGVAPSAAPFILATHQGYQFFYCSIGVDNPPVFLYVEGSPVPAVPFKASVLAFAQWAIESKIAHLESGR